MFTLRRLSLTGLGAGLATVTVGLAALALNDQGSASQLPVEPVERLEDAPPPPALTYEYLDASGTFVAPEWDNRDLGDEKKAADPWVNPAWQLFGQCLADGGLEVREDKAEKLTQKHIDKLLERVNKEHPNKDSNKQVARQGLRGAAGSARVYLTCAYEWLSKSPREIYELTGEPNEWWPPQTENPTADQKP